MSTSTDERVDLAGDDVDDVDHYICDRCYPDESLPCVARSLCGVVMEIDDDNKAEQDTVGCPLCMIVAGTGCPVCGYGS